VTWISQAEGITRDGDGEVRIGRLKRVPRASGCGCMRVCRISCLWTNDTLCRWLDQACTNVVIVAHQGGQQEKVACSEPEMGLTSLLPGSSAMTANHNSNTLPTESKTNLVPQATVCSLTESSEMFCYSPPRLMVPKLACVTQYPMSIYG